MSHVDDGTLHALVDDELSGAERNAVEAHLAGCGDCARRFAEATAMAREVHTLLGALDEVPTPVRVDAPRARALPPRERQTPPQRVHTMRTWQRVAIAASLLVVAGVSYRVRLRDPLVDGVAERSMVSPAAGSADTAPPVAEVGAAAAVTATVPRDSARPRAAVRTGSGQAVIATRAVAPTASQPVALIVPATEPVPPAARAASPAAAGRMEARKMVASLSPAERRSSAFNMDAASAEDAASGMVTAEASAALAGYRSVEEVTLPSVIRRRYVSADGTTLVLLIAPSTAVGSTTAATSPEFTVSTTNGRSTVRWLVPGRSYELQGALTPDSLVKLATQLR